jgi:hypothetical protein
MKVNKISSRDEYFDVQIQRSKQKYDYCKVNVSEVKFFHNILKPILGDVGPILCLGTRNGREIDLFRNIFFGNKYLNKIYKKDVIGVELNPNAKREDTWIGSFDEMPKQWSGKFSLLYSNSFDQSMDPLKTALEWKRVLREGGIIIMGFAEGAEPTESDPVGNISYGDLLKLFGGELIFFSKYGFHYSYLVLRL